MALLPYDFESPFRLLEREFLRPQRDFFGYTPFDQMVSRGVGPAEQMLRSWDNVFKPIEQLTNTLNQLGLRDSSSTNITSDDEKFQVSVDVQHFAPEEINVKVINRHVVIEGKHEEKRDEHGYVARQFVRRYALPQGCLPDTVQSSLSSDGVLTVTAPKVLAMPSTGERIVPITHTGPIKKRIGSPTMEAVTES